MNGEDTLPPEQVLALAYARSEHRAAIEAMLRLDRNLARSVAQASEPIVGQLRLAWWRDALSASPDQRPQGNPLLDQVAQAFGHNLKDLRALVDGWESMLLTEALTVASIEQFLVGREDAWMSVASRVDPSAQQENIRSAARRWALGDLLSGLSDSDDREALLAIAMTDPYQTRLLPRSLRSLGILAALANRSISQGGKPLLGDRIAALVALRSGIFGR